MQTRQGLHGVCHNFAHVQLSETISGLESSIAGISEIRGIPSPVAYISEANENYISFKLVYHMDNYGAQHSIGDKIYRNGFKALHEKGIRLARPYLEVNSQLINSQLNS